MSRGFGAMQRTILKTMEAAMRYELHNGALATPLCRGAKIYHRFVRQFQSRISTQLFGNEAPTGAISDNPRLSAMHNIPSPLFSVSFLHVFYGLPTDSYVRLKCRNNAQSGHRLTRFCKNT